MAIEIQGVSAAYGRTKVVRNVSIAVPRKSVVALLGPNGAGKTTLLRVAAGLMRPEEGSVSIFGAIVTRETPNQRARRGVCLVPEGRGIFRSLTVAENLLLYRPRWVHEDRVDLAIDAFPLLKPRLKQPAASLSGGQQQMLALARVFISQPRVVLLDEVSMGLAPIVVEQIFEALLGLAQEGISLLVVEQYVNRALEICDHAYIINRGRITFSGQPASLNEQDVLKDYLGVNLEASG